MGDLAYLGPVGPFAGLSNAARKKVGERFPALSIVEIENAAASFLMELQATELEPRLVEAREELNIFAREIARFHCALSQLRRRRLDHALGEASRLISGQNDVEDLERALDNLRAALRQTSRVLPPGQPQLASRRLIATLASQMKYAGLPINRAASDSLRSLVELIFDDLMVGADAARAVREWNQCQTGDIDQERANLLLELIP